MRDQRHDPNSAALPGTGNLPGAHTPSISETIVRLSAQVARRDAAIDLIKTWGPAPVWHTGRPMTPQEITDQAYALVDSLAALRATAPTPAPTQVPTPAPAEAPTPPDPTSPTPVSDTSRSLVQLLDTYVERVRCDERYAEQYRSRARGYNAAGGRQLERQTWADRQAPITRIRDIAEAAAGRRVSPAVGLTRSQVDDLERLVSSACYAAYHTDPNLWTPLDETKTPDRERDVLNKFIAALPVVPDQD